VRTPALLAELKVLMPAISITALICQALLPVGIGAKKAYLGG
jgi:hypothetical protein